MQFTWIILRNHKDNPKLLESGIKRGDVGHVKTWHPNLGTGTAYFPSIKKNLPVTEENII